MKYSAIDRAFHRLAFSSPPLQTVAIDLEKSLFRRRCADVDLAPPIFVTALPRCGTTLLLEIVNVADEVATHTYRDMPFILAPILWDAFSRNFRKPASLSERAHGDGMQIGYDSPEAFEEVIWRHFWPEKYGATQLDIWQADDGEANARTFFVEHFRKIAWLRGAAQRPGARYVSKNNGNIARLAIIRTMFDEAVVVVLIREPLAHAHSLWRQHRRFDGMQAEDRFVARYMTDIGHYEFGKAHRPFAFPGFAPAEFGLTPNDIDYWLLYWLAAYRHVRAQGTRPIIIAYERLCAATDVEVARLCDIAALPRDSILAEAKRRIDPTAKPELDRTLFRADWVSEAEALYTELVG